MFSNFSVRNTSTIHVIAVLILVTLRFAINCFGAYRIICQFLWSSGRFVLMKYIWQDRPFAEISKDCYYDRATCCLGRI